MKAKYIPNILSIIRILMVPLFVVLFFKDMHVSAVIVFVVAGLTDVVDGILARKFNWITNIGKILDPLADKLMQCVVLICLFIDRIIPWWVLAICVGKELLMASGALFLFKKEKVVVVSGWCGKMAVCIFYAAIFSMIVFPAMYYTVKLIICGITVAATVFAISKYYYDYMKSEKALRRELENAKKSTN